MLNLFSLKSGGGWKKSPLFEVKKCHVNPDTKIPAIKNSIDLFYSLIHLDTILFDRVSCYTMILSFVISYFC